jgi:hypothetical protein
MVVPMGFTASPTSQTLLPASLQFLARPFDEGNLIRAAYAYEQATKIRRYHPHPYLSRLKMTSHPPSSPTYQQALLPRHKHPLPLPTHRLFPPPLLHN